MSALGVSPSTAGLRCNARIKRCKITIRSTCAVFANALSRGIRLLGALELALKVSTKVMRQSGQHNEGLNRCGITRRQTRTITTAGIQNESPLAWRLHEEARKIEERIVSDPKFYGRIYGVDKEDDPADPATWIKANPLLKENGGFLDIEKIRVKYISREAEGDLTSFKRYYLNTWDQKESHAIDIAKWDAFAGD